MDEREKKGTYNPLLELAEEIVRLKQLNALLGFVQTAFADGASVIPEEEADRALYHIYETQREILTRMQKRIDEARG